MRFSFRAPPCRARRSRARCANELLEDLERHGSISTDFAKDLFGACPVEPPFTRADAREPDAKSGRALRELDHFLQRRDERRPLRLRGRVFLNAEAVDRVSPFAPHEHVTQGEAL